MITIGAIWEKKGVRIKQGSVEKCIKRWREMVKYIWVVTEHDASYE